MIGSGAVQTAATIYGATELIMRAPGVFGYEWNVNPDRLSANGWLRRTAAESGAQSSAQLEKLKSSYAADEVLNADRAGSGLKTDPTHRAPSFLSREQLAEGKTFTIRGNDGVQRTLLQTMGEMNGKNGVFEYIIDPKGNVVHQRFIEGGAITGTPNVNPRDLPQ